MRHPYWRGSSLISDCPLPIGNWPFSPRPPRQCRTPRSCTCSRPFDANWVRTHLALSALSRRMAPGPLTCRLRSSCCEGLAPLESPYCCSAPPSPLCTCWITWQPMTCIVSFRPAQRARDRRLQGPLAPSAESGAARAHLTAPRHFPQPHHLRVPACASLAHRPTIVPLTVHALRTTQHAPSASPPGAGAGHFARDRARSRRGRNRFDSRVRLGQCLFGDGDSNGSFGDSLRRWLRPCRAGGFGRAARVLADGNLSRNRPGQPKMDAGQM